MAPLSDEDRLLINVLWTEKRMDNWENDFWVSSGTVETASVVWSRAMDWFYRQRCPADW